MHEKAQALVLVGQCPEPEEVPPRVPLLYVASATSAYTVASISSQQAGGKPRRAPLVLLNLHDNTIK